MGAFECKLEGAHHLEIKKCEKQNLLHPPPPLRGTTQISLFIYFDIVNSPYIHFTPKYPGFGLKMIF